MIIDTTPCETRKANQWESIVLDMRGVDRMYYFERDTGEQSVLFSEEALMDFIPSMTVSEFIEEDIHSQSSKWLHATSCLENGKHPHWYKGEYYKKDTEFLRLNEWFSIASDLIQQYQKDSAKVVVADSRKRLDNPWKFIMIIR